MGTCKRERGRFTWKNGRVLCVCVWVCVCVEGELVKTLLRLEIASPLLLYLRCDNIFLAAYENSIRSFGFRGDSYYRSGFPWPCIPRGLLDSFIERINCCSPTPGDLRSYSPLAPCRSYDETHKPVS